MSRISEPIGWNQEFSRWWRCWSVSQPFWFLQSGYRKQWSWRNLRKSVFPIDYLVPAGSIWDSGVSYWTPDCGTIGSNSPADSALQIRWHLRQRIEEEHVPGLVLYIAPLHNRYAVNSMSDKSTWHSVDGRILFQYVSSGGYLTNFG